MKGLTVDYGNGEIAPDSWSDLGGLPRQRQPLHLAFGKPRKPAGELSVHFIPGCAWAISDSSGDRPAAGL